MNTGQMSQLKRVHQRPDQAALQQVPMGWGSGMGENGGSRLHP